FYGTPPPAEPVVSVTNEAGDDRREQRDDHHDIFSDKCSDLLSEAIRFCALMAHRDLQPLFL
ncbi:MAG: hypothetical protein ACI3W8_01035, partial [Oscillospiraceae bacterium]